MSKLKAGTTAPIFKTSDIFGKQINLEAYKGKKLMVSFYRYAACPLCNLRVNDLIQQYPKLNANGLEMLAIFQSPTESILKYVGKQDAPFSIIPDPKLKLYRQYKVEGDWLKFLKGLKPTNVIAAAKKGFMPGIPDNEINMIPADFLIDEQGKIHTAYYGKDSADHLELTAIEDFLNS